MAKFNRHSISAYSHGFSLIELLVVVSIVGIISYSSAPQFGEMMVKNELKSATSTMLKTLLRAKYIAQTQATIVKIVITNKSIVLTPGNTGQSLSIKLPDSISVTNNTTLNFDAMGLLMNIVKDKKIKLKTNRSPTKESTVTISTTGLIAAL